MNDTIVACSTARGKGAIAVIRMSGDRAKKIAEELFYPMPKAANMLRKGEFRAEYFTDSGMCVYFDSPHSMTGEDCVELYLHGGTAIVDGAVRECILHGARLAYNGEFSKRAFINGKLTLDACEGVIEMIEAESALQVRSGYGVLTGKLSQNVNKMQDVLTELIARVEVALDYPEEDLEMITVEGAVTELKTVKAEIEGLLRASAAAPIVKNGANIVITGRVNVGKSSLLNALVGSDRVIVSNEEGTTRDIIEASVSYRDMRFNFLDTAGLRETDSSIEAEGIRRAKNAAQNADLILFVTDNEEEYCDFQGNAPVIRVLNKSDKNKYDDKCGSAIVSATNGEGIEALKERIYSVFEQKGVKDSLIITNARQLDCLSRANKALFDALNAAECATMDCMAQPLYAAWSAMGEITGRTVTEEIVDTVFSKFCLGK